MLYEKGPFSSRIAQLGATTARTRYVSFLSLDERSQRRGPIFRLKIDARSTAVTANSRGYHTDALLYTVGAQLRPVQPLLYAP